MMLNLRFSFSKIPQWANFDPYLLKPQNHKVQQYLNNKWFDSQKYTDILDPLHGFDLNQVPVSTQQETQLFIDNAKKQSKVGQHNLFKNPHRFQEYGEFFFRVVQEMKKPEVEQYFIKLVQRTVPKSDIQCKGEVVVTRRFFENFIGDNPRISMRGFVQAGDHNGQTSTGFRFPYGPVMIISPFNFPLEIPALQIYGALLAGNRVTFKGDQRVNLVMEQFFRMCEYLDMPKNDLDFYSGSNDLTENLLLNGNFRNTQFTGSSKVAEILCEKLRGKIKIEDAGFDFKILGPDVQEEEYVAYQCDQDAYASIGQKCSAQSILFAHQNWIQAGIIDKLQALASKRNLENLTSGPILTQTNESIEKHINNLLQIPGAKILFGGEKWENHNIPEFYGTYKPTAIYVPFEQIDQNFKLIQTEIFGPFQIISSYRDNQIDQCIDFLQRFDNHLTCGVVSNDVRFVNKFVQNTINGVTYTGIKARTTGAPQNHWFGPCGDPRGAGIGTIEAILTTWTTHREIITDIGSTQDVKLIQS